MVSTETRGGAVRQSPSAGFCCSVVVPVFNGAKDLGRLLVLLENQSTESSGFEVIVCDDGSTESCRSVVAEFQRSFPSIRYLRQDIRGAAAAKNMGILHAKSDVVVFLNSDVEPDRHLIARLTTALAENPDWHGAESRLLPVGEVTNISPGASPLHPLPPALAWGPKPVLFWGSQRYAGWGTGG